MSTDRSRLPVVVIGAGPVGLAAAAHLAERGIAYEIVFVEWNPVPGRPYLSELLARRFPSRAPATLRRIIVAPQYHTAMEQNPHAGYLEYVARNVGIRRAAAPMSRPWPSTSAASKRCRRWKRRCARGSAAPIS